MILLNHSQIEALLNNMAAQLRMHLQEEQAPVYMLGIHTGGYWIAERFCERIGLKSELGGLDIHLYRDDFSRIGIRYPVHPSHLPWGIDNATIILVDDVLHTGRTIRAALNALFDYGRPARIILAILVQRRGRELPVSADIVGTDMVLPDDQHLKLYGPELLSLHQVTRASRS